jgi:hypothetical protein
VCACVCVLTLLIKCLVLLTASHMNTLNKQQVGISRAKCRSQFKADWAKVCSLSDRENGEDYVYNDMA